MRAHLDPNSSRGCGPVAALRIRGRVVAALAAAAASVALISTPRAGDVAPFDKLVRIYDYDANAPLDLQETSASEAAGATVHEISYASPKGGRVTAYLVTPQGKGPFAGVIFLHTGQGDKSQFVYEAALYSAAGAVSVSIDAPFIRPAPWTRSGGGGFTDPQGDRDLYIQSVVDIRRGVDLLIARGDVDPKRIAYVGHSFGATWGGVIAGVEKRFKALVLMAGLPELARDTFDTRHPILADQLKGVTPDVKEKYIAATEDLDAVHYVGHAAPAALLLQFARFDIFISKAQAATYERAASDPKTTLWYDTGHELNDPRALLDRAAFLGRQIGLKGVEKIVEARVRGSSR